MYKQKGSILPVLLIFLVATAAAGYFLLGMRGIIDLYNQIRYISPGQIPDATPDIKTTQNPTSNAQIIITNQGFSPSSITVSKDQQVVWENSDSKNHQIVPFPNSAANNSALPGFDSDILEKNDQFIYVFEKSGEYTYQDNIYKFKGIIKVE